MGTAETKYVTVEQGEKAQIVRFLTDTLLDPMQVEAISAQLSVAFSQSSTANMVVALDEVTQVSSLMLSVLIDLRDKAAQKGGVIALAAVPDSVDYVLRTTELDKVFAMHETVEDALAGL